MAFRLADFIVCGEIDNTRKNSVHGWLELQGTERTMALSLTGNCDPDLFGRRFRFEPRKPPEPGLPGPADETEEAALGRLGLQGVSWQQIGPTGTMTAARKVRVADCSTEELLRRYELGEPPPMEWKRCLYLEWWSQNGNVVIELPDPVIEFLEPVPDPPADLFEDDADDLDPDALDTGLLDPDEIFDLPGSLDVTSIRFNEDGEPEIERNPFELEEEEPADEYGLIPDDLQQQLDAETRATDWALRESAPPGIADGSEDHIREMDLMDNVIEHGRGQLLGSIFEGFVELPPPDSLDEQAAEQHLKVALGRMAMLGIALNVCEHYTFLQAYRLLVEELCREECFFPEISGTSWVQHFDTAEHCDQCQAQFEEDEDHDNDDDDDDDDDEDDD